MSYGEELNVRKARIKRTAPHGDLTVKLTRDGIRALRELRHRLLEGNANELEVEAACIAAFFDGYRQVRPEENGDLTSAPIIADGVERWGFLDYQITSFIAELLCGRETFWTRAR